MLKEEGVVIVVSTNRYKWMDIELEAGADLGGGFIMKHSAYYRLESSVDNRYRYEYDNPDVNLHLSCFDEVSGVLQLMKFYRHIAEKHYGCVGKCASGEGNDNQRHLAHLAVEYIGADRRSTCCNYTPPKLSKKDRQARKRARGGYDND